MMRSSLPLLVIALGPWLALQERQGVTTPEDTTEEDLAAKHKPKYDDGFEYDKSDEMLDKMGLTASSVYDYAEKNVDPAADKSLDLSEKMGKQAASFVDKIHSFQSGVMKYRKKLTQLHQIEAGEIKSHMEDAQAQTIRMGHRPQGSAVMSRTYGHGEKGAADQAAEQDAADENAGEEEEDDESFLQKQDSHQANNGGVSNGADVALLEVHSSSAPAVSGSSKAATGKDSSDEGEKRPSMTGMAKWASRKMSGASKSMTNARRGKKEDSSTDQDEDVPPELKYPDFGEWGRMYSGKYDALNKRITRPLDKKAHDAVMKSMKVGFALDGLRNDIRDMTDSTQQVYVKHMNEQFARQAANFHKELDEEKADLFSAANAGQEQPEGFWQEAMDHERDHGEDHFGNGMLGLSDAAKEDAKTRSGESSALELSSHTTAAKKSKWDKDEFEPDPHATPELSYDRYRNQAQLFADHGKKIEEGLDKMMDKVPDMRQRSQDYKNMVKELKNRVIQLGAKDLRQVRQEVSKEKKEEIHDINNLDVSEVFTDRHKQVLHEAKPADWALIKEQKFANNPKLPGDLQNPYDDMSRNRWNSE